MYNKEKKEFLLYKNKENKIKHIYIKKEGLNNT